MPGNQSESSVGGILRVVKGENEATPVRAGCSPLQDIESPRLVLFYSFFLLSMNSPIFLIMHFFVTEEV